MFNRFSIITLDSYHSLFDIKQESSVPPSFIYGSLVIHYSLNFITYKAASRGFLFDVGLLWPCKSMPRSAKDIASMPRTLQSMPRLAEDVDKHA